MKKIFISLPLTSSLSYLSKFQMLKKQKGDNLFLKEMHPLQLYRTSDNLSLFMVKFNHFFAK